VSRAALSNLDNGTRSLSEAEEQALRQVISEGENEEKTTNVDTKNEKGSEEPTTDVTTDVNGGNDASKEEGETEEKDPANTPDEGEGENGAEDSDETGDSEKEDGEEEQKPVDPVEDENQDPAENNPEDENGEEDADGPALGPSETPELDETEGLESLETALLEGEEPGVSAAQNYKYYAYGWGYDPFGALAQSQINGIYSATQHTPVPLLLHASEELDENNNRIVDPVVDVAGITAGRSYTVYWMYDGTEDGEINGTVMASGYNQLDQLGAEIALAEKRNLICTTLEGLAKIRETEDAI